MLAGSEKLSGYLGNRTQMACSSCFGDAGLCRDSIGEKQFTDDRFSVNCGAQSGLGHLRHSCRPACGGRSLPSLAWWNRKKRCARLRCVLHVSSHKQQLHEALDDEIFPLVGFGQHGLI